MTALLVRTAQISDHYLHRLFAVPYVYAMDSLVATVIVETRCATSV